MNGGRTVRSRPGVLGALLLSLASLATTGADDPPADTLVLFDGKTLDGWKRTDFYKAGEVRVEDGRIVLHDGGSMTGITTTRTDLPTSDYELRYEAMRLKGSDFFAAATFPVGKSHASLINGGWGGTVTGLSSLDGADASENETGHFRKYQDKTWYTFRVRVTDKVIRCWIDDDEAVTVDRTDRQVSTRIEVNRNRPLGFATWETSGALRGITMRRLSPAEIEETDKIAQEE
jgi:hypothetical protein